MASTLSYMGRLFPFPGLGEVESYVVLAVVAVLIALGIRSMLRRDGANR